MTEEDMGGGNASAADNVGSRLRAAREARGLSLGQVAAQTRISQRALASLEECDFSAMPGRTYAIGFARTYARMVGLDGEAVAAQVRREIDRNAPDPTPRQATFEPGDPARVPSSRLVWIVAAVLLAVLAGGYFTFRSLFAPAQELPSLLAPDDASPAAASAAGAPASGAAAAPAQGGPAQDGPVVFTALEEGIWVKFYDANGQQLMQKLMAKGESYAVPPTAQGPQLWTGRPEALAITIGGKAVAKLSDVQRTVRDVPVTAVALLGRAEPTPAATE